MLLGLLLYIAAVVILAFIAKETDRRIGLRRRAESRLDL